MPLITSIMYNIRVIYYNILEMIFCYNFTCDDPNWIIYSSGYLSIESLNVCISNFLESSSSFYFQTCLCRSRPMIDDSKSKTSQQCIIKRIEFAWFLVVHTNQFGRRLFISPRPWPIFSEFFIIFAFWKIYLIIHKYIYIIENEFVPWITMNSYIIHFNALFKEANRRNSTEIFILMTLCTVMFIIMMNFI